MFTTILILWLPCLLVFLSSSHQQFLSQSLSGKLTWPIFVLSLPGCWWLNLPQYGPVASGIMVLFSVMLIWITIVLCHGHLKVRLLPFTLAGGLTCVGLISVIGVAATIRHAIEQGIVYVV